MAGEPEPLPPRRRLQVHLSTCVALTFAVGLLLWINFRPAPRLEVSRGNSYYIFTELVRPIGWPMTAYEARFHVQDLDTIRRERLLYEADTESTWRELAREFPGTKALPLDLKIVMTSKTLDEPVTPEVRYELNKVLLWKGMPNLLDMQGTWNARGLAIDLGVAVFGLLSVAVASEWLIRRRMEHAGAAGQVSC